MYSVFILPFSFPVNRKVLKNQIELTNMKTCKENSNHADENSTILCDDVVTLKLLTHIYTSTR